MPSLAVDTAQCSGRLYLLGANLTEWQPAGHKPVLFTSRASWFKDGHAIRGGVPICLPWFGPHPKDPDAPSHGLVRTKSWNVIGTRETHDGIEIELVTNLDHLHVTYRVMMGHTLQLKLIVANTSEASQKFEAALHTYLAVEDATQVEIAGLEDCSFIDQLQGSKVIAPTGKPIRFTEEVDRVYQGTQATCVLKDATAGRQITVVKSGSESTVIWNPWTAKAARLEDMGDEEWQKMCCIETANIGDHAVTISPGGNHEMTVTISVDE